MLAIWSLVPLPFLKPAWISGSSLFMYCWSLAWRTLSITLLFHSNPILLIKPYKLSIIISGLPWWLSGKESVCHVGDCLPCRRHRFIPRVGKIPWRRKWQLTPIFLPWILAILAMEKSYGQGSLVGYSLWGHKSQTQLGDLNHHHHFRFRGMRNWGTKWFSSFV